ncbi:MAG: hypothetical protein AB1453_15070, partial [Chloroflexota bacterium]
NHSLDNFVFVITVLLVFLMAARTPLDSDMWWHLKAGQISLLQRSPLLSDIFSFTQYGEAWINHSWLGQIILFLMYDSSGFWGLGYAVALLVSATFAVLYRMMAGPPLLKLGIIILAATVSSFVWSPRPQLFSLLLFALWLGVLTALKKGRLNQAWLLLPIAILWSNLHGGYSLGFLLLLALLAGEILDWMRGGPDSQPRSGKMVFRLLPWIGITLLAVLINPNGINTWIIPFRTIGVENLRHFIDEWSSPNFHLLTMQPFLWLMFLTFFSMVFTKERVSGFELIATIGFAYMALVAKRNFAPFALVSALVLSRHLPFVLEGLLAKPTTWAKNYSKAAPVQKSLPGGVRKGINFSIAVILAVSVIIKLYVVTHPILIQKYEAQYYPVAAAAHLRAMPNDGNLLNGYGWGGYLIWTNPNQKVFVDGRTDLFGDEILTDYITITQAATGWDEKMAQWDIQRVLVEPHQPIVKKLIETGWQEVYRDEISVLLVR